MEKQLPILIEKSRMLNWPFWLGVGFFILVVIGLIRLSLNTMDWLSNDGDVPVHEIVIMGDRQYTHDEEVMKAINPVQLASLFNLNVNRVQTEIESLPWVYSASVRKQWPDRLHVYLVEQEPIAIWNNDLLLNQHSEVFMAPLDNIVEVLPKIFGPAGSEKEAWNEFKGLNALLKINEFEIKELFLSERFAWQIWLDNGIQLNLGQKERVERVQWFIDLYPTIKQYREAPIEIVDLRYDTGLAVQWKSEIKESQKS